MSSTHYDESELSDYQNLIITDQGSIFIHLSGTHTAYGRNPKKRKLIWNNLMTPLSPHVHHYLQQFNKHNIKPNYTSLLSCIDKQWVWQFMYNNIK